MIRLRRPLVLLALAAATLQVPVFAADEITDTFQEGVAALKEGRNEDALHAFQKVLALDPSQEEAYALWQSTDEQIWLDMLVDSGEMELVARRFLDLATLGRKAKTNDPDAIRALLGQIDTNDVVQRTRAIRKLAADHGEYAVPFILYALADQDDADKRVIYMQALTRMGDDVVPPLIEGLDSPDAFLRRNVALTLGYISDPRASGELANLAANDSDSSVRAAATQALSQCGGTTDAVGQLLDKGEAYYRHDPSVLSPGEYSDVVWTWQGNGIVSTPVPRWLYAEEMAKKAFVRALAIEPSSSRAIADIARALASEQAELAQREGSGYDSGDWPQKLADDQLALGVAGEAALDDALGRALGSGDALAAAGLVHTLQDCAATETPNLARALEVSSSGVVRGEAAVALGTIAARNHVAASSSTVAALAEAVGRDVSRLAAVIDPDGTRRDAIVSALASEGVMATPFANGARGIAGLRSLPGTDAIVLAEEPGKVTAAQVLDEIQRDERYKDVPVIVVAADADAAKDVFGDRAAAIITGADGAAQVVDAMSDRMNVERERADDLSARSAHALLALARGGMSDLGGAEGSLLQAITGRPDAVAVPALGALGVVGGNDVIAPVAAVLADGERSEDVRTAAARALAGVFARVGRVDESTLGGLIEVCRSDAPYAVRRETAAALGRLELSDEVRAEILRSLRARLATGS